MGKVGGRGEDPFKLPHWRERGRGRGMEGYKEVEGGGG